jgi:hypothetical protein
MNEGQFSSTLYRRIAAKGFRDLSSFLRAREGTTYLGLSDEIGVPALVIMAIHRWEAKENGAMLEFAKDSLVRFLRQYTKRGWNRGVNAESNRANAWATWVTRLTNCAEDTVLQERASAVWSALKDMSPSADWVPTGNSDAYIVNAFQRGWPTKS